MTWFQVYLLIGVVLAIVLAAGMIPGLLKQHTITVRISLPVLAWIGLAGLVLVLLGWGLSHLLP